MDNPFCQSRKETEDERFIRIKSMGEYYICVECNGTGLDNYSTFHEYTLWDGQSKCKVCNGLGVFDWVENATCGVKTKLVDKEEIENGKYNEISM